MAHLISPDGSVKFTIRHRAVCQDDKFKGEWHDNVESAKRDAISHRKQSGNQNHVIQIITQQTLTVNFKEAENA